MAGNKYVSLIGGTLQQTAANQSSAGSGDAGKLVALNASGLIDSTMLPEAISTTVTASENLATGALVNIWNSSGTLKVRNANASTPLQCDGFAPIAISSAGSGQVTLNGGVITGLTGLTLGTRYYVDNITPGGVTSTPVSTGGYINQYAGIALSTTSLAFQIGTVCIY